jgi:heat shock protein beta
VFGGRSALAKGHQNRKDWDHDGLTNVQERKLTKMGIPSDKKVADTNGNGIVDGQEDSDGDGLTNAQEFEDSTDPTDTDSDDDGISDDQEDADDDGIANVDDDGNDDSGDDDAVAAHA